MKRTRENLVVLAESIIMSIIIVGVSYAQPKIGRKNIPSNASPEVRKEIKRLYSLRVSVRQDAASKLGEIKEKAADAVPFLISMLDDYPHGESPFPWGYQVGEAPAVVATRALAAIGKPAIEQLILATKGPCDVNAFEALGQMGSLAVEPLLDILNNEDEYYRTRKLAASALEKAGYRRAAEPFHP